MAAVDLTPLLGAVDFSGTVVVLIAVASGLLGVVITVLAAHWVMTMVSGQVWSHGRYWDRDVYESALADVKRQSRAGVLVDKRSRAAVDRFEGRRSARRSLRVRRL